MRPALSTHEGPQEQGNLHGAVVNLLRLRDAARPHLPRRGVCVARGCGCMRGGVHAAAVCQWEATGEGEGMCHTMDRSSTTVVAQTALVPSTAGVFRPTSLAPRGR